jgi:3'-phosphoadenosine 5'-phosphosulfate sulfotransferase (PAPS reductase)/FAD synthetase
MRKQRYEAWQLSQRQSLPLAGKIRLSEQRIREFHEHCQGKTAVSFSGGKDSTVLLNLVRNLYPDTPAVFVDTGLEYPEIREFVKTIPNVTWLKPFKTFKKILEDEGYPVVSKKVATMLRQCQNPTEKNQATRKLVLTGVNSEGKASTFKLPAKYRHYVNAPFKISEKCCDHMKKRPFYWYHKETGRFPYVGTMASDSKIRQMAWLSSGCNNFNGTKTQSKPLSIWKEEDIWEYLKTEGLPYSKIYDMGYKRTGCMFCMFGLQKELNPNRFHLMKKTHPKLYDYCINKLGLKPILDYMRILY